MSKKEVKLYENMMVRGQTQRWGKLTMLIMSGEGAVLIPTMEFNSHQKWGMSKNSTGTAMRDRNMFIDRVEALIARPSSFTQTRGNNKALETIVKLMSECGLDPKEWVLPPELKNLKSAMAEEPKDKDEDKDKKQKKAFEPAPAAAAPMTTPAPAPAVPVEQQGFWVREKTPGP